MKELQFCEDLQNDLLKGALIVSSHKCKYLSSILVRLPKGKFYKDSGDEREFEYKEYNQEFLENSIEMYHAVSRNGTIREVKKIISKEYYADRFLISRGVKLGNSKLA